MPPKKRQTCGKVPAYVALHFPSDDSSGIAPVSKLIGNPAVLAKTRNKPVQVIWNAKVTEAFIIEFADNEESLAKSINDYFHHDDETCSKPTPAKRRKISPEEKTVTQSKTASKIKCVALTSEPSANIETSEASFPNYKISPELEMTVQQFKQSKRSTETQTVLIRSTTNTTQTLSAQKVSMMTQTNQPTKSVSICTQTTPDQPQSHAVSTQTTSTSGGDICTGTQTEIVVGAKEKDVSLETSLNVSELLGYSDIEKSVSKNTKQLKENREQLDNITSVLASIQSLLQTWQTVQSYPISQVSTQLQLPTVSPTTTDSLNSIFQASDRNNDENNPPGTTFSDNYDMPLQTITPDQNQCTEASNKEKVVVRNPSFLKLSMKTILAEKPSNIIALASGKLPSAPVIDHRLNIPEGILNETTISAFNTRRKFAVNLFRQLCSCEDVLNKNVNGKVFSSAIQNKGQIEKMKISAIKMASFQHFPCSPADHEPMWSDVVRAIDKANWVFHRYVRNHFDLQDILN